jgi:hypothetical protein
MGIAEQLQAVCDVVTGANKTTNNPLVEIHTGKGSIYVVSLSDLREAECVDLPNGSIINMKEASIACAEGCEESTYTLIFFPWNLVPNIPPGARVVKARLA